METQQDDHIELDPETQQDYIVETAPEEKEDDSNDSKPKMQPVDIEKSAQEIQRDKTKTPGSTILEVLNPSYFRLIFAYLTITDIVRSEGVSRGWRDLVLQYLSTFENYHIKHATGDCKVPDRYHSFRSIILFEPKGDINKMAHKMGPYFVRVYSNCIDEEGAKAITVHCPKLEYLMLKDTLIKPHCEETPDEFTDEKTPPKRELTGMFLTDLRTDLKTLGLSALPALKEEYLQLAVPRLTGLTRLDMNFNSVESLRHVSATLENMPLLEHLSLMNYEQSTFPPIEAPCFDRLLYLRELHLWGNEFVTDSWVQAAAACKALRVFNVGVCLRITVKSVIALCKKRRKLTELVVANLSVSNLNLKACLRYCKDLELLDVSWCAKLRRKVLAHISRPNTRPLVIRARGTDLPKCIKSYEGLIIRTDIPPVMYNPLAFDVEGNDSVGDRRMSVEDVIPKEGNVEGNDHEHYSVDDRRMSVEDVIPKEGNVEGNDHEHYSVDDRRMSVEDVILKEENVVEEGSAADVLPAGNAIVIDLRDIHAEDVNLGNRPEDELREGAAMHAEDEDDNVEDDEHADATHAEDDVRAGSMHAGDNVVIEDIRHAEDDILRRIVGLAESARRAGDAIREEAPMHDEEIRAEGAIIPDNVIPAPDALPAEDDVLIQEEDIHAEEPIMNAILAEDDRRAEDAMHADYAIRPEIDIRVEVNIRPLIVAPEEDIIRARDDINVIGEEGDIRRERERPVVIIPQEDIINAQDDLLIIGRRAENDVDEERIPQENLIRAVAVVHEINDVNEQNGQADEIYQNGIHPEDYILPEDDIMADDEMDDDDDDGYRVRVNLQEQNAAGDRLAEDRLFPNNEPEVFAIQARPRLNGDHERDMRVLDRMYEEYGVEVDNGGAVVNGANAENGMNEGNGMNVGNGLALAPPNDVFANDFLFMDDDILMEDEDDDQV